MSVYLMGYIRRVDWLMQLLIDKPNTVELTVSFFANLILILWSISICFKVKV